MITKRQSGIAPMAQTQVFNHYNTSSQNVLSSHNIITPSQHTLSTHCVPLITVCLVLTSTSTHPFSSSIISYPSNILPSYTLSTHHLIFSTTYHLPTHPLLHSSLPTHPLLNPTPPDPPRHFFAPSVQLFPRLRVRKKMQNLSSTMYILSLVSHCYPSLIYIKDVTSLSQHKISYQSYIYPHRTCGKNGQVVFSS